MPNIIDLNTINENFLFYKLCFSLSVYNSKNIIVDMILFSFQEWEKLFRLYMYILNENTKPSLSFMTKKIFFNIITKKL